MIQQIDQLILTGQLEAAAILINDAIKSGIDLQGKHIKYANVLLLSCDWNKIESIMPKNINFFITSGWLNSLLSSRPVNNNSAPIPWLTYPAIDFLDSIVKQNWKTFEWGSGNSTLWWASKIDSVVAIEDNTGWYKEIISKMPDNAFVYNKIDKAEYVNSIKLYDDKSFDVIVIDGSHRNDCAKNAINKLKDSGVIVFDNSDSSEYDESMDIFCNNGFFRIDFWGLFPSYMYKNCTSVFFRNSSLLKKSPPPSQHVSSVGISCFQAIEKINKISELDTIIPPEIKDDEFYSIIKKLASEACVRTILEIGSSAGGGSTEAFVSGVRDNPEHPSLFCMEVSKPRFTQLQQRYASETFVHCYNVSSVTLAQFPSEKEVELFYKWIPSVLNNFPLERVIGWLRQDIEYVANSGVPRDGIKMIMREQGISTFDMVLIDGSEFTGMAELDEVYGANYILLDDINGFKNRNNYQRLSEDPSYTLIQENWEVRNGYAVFSKVLEELPIHFFTIVLNGEPFIRYHIDVFQTLPFRWHWHIVEGVADLQHDTAWCVASGGRITDELHNNGLSNDGTTEYLDWLARHFPENITIYRKVNGAFWDGKLEMVQTPLQNIREESVLWQVDADELWTSRQITKMQYLFFSDPDKSSAYFYCDYFVGAYKYVSSLNTWATNPFDWLRAWRYRPGMHWSSHEPPILKNPQGRDVGKINPFMRDETVEQGVIFQHFAYITEAQVRFKELYYGYNQALEHWQRLQKTVGSVNPANYLPWAIDGAVVDDWPTANGALLCEKLLPSLSHPRQYSSMSVEGFTQFEHELNKLFKEIRPVKIIETGTFLGQGTTSIIWRAIKAFELNADFTTIEVNTEHYRQAIAYFTANDMDIRAELGLSIPRIKLPTTEQITESFVEHKEFEGIYYDHDENDRSWLYHLETDFAVPDNVLYDAMLRYNFRPDFVLLDSAGHIGFSEFEYFLSLVQDDCFLMLDDVFHCKHFKTLNFIKNDSRFSVIVESPEKFGFCIAKYTHRKTILIIRTDTIGDNILFMPTLPHIRKKYPTAKIIVCCQDTVAELYEASPFVDGIVPFNHLRAYIDENYRESISKHLQNVNADIAINAAFTRQLLNEYFTLGCGAAEKIGFYGDLCELSPETRDADNPLYTLLIESAGENKPELERNLDLLAGLGIPVSALEPMIWTSPDDVLFAEQFIADHQLNPSKSIALFVTGRHEDKQYPRYPEALGRICREQGFTLIAFGAERDHEISTVALDVPGVRGTNLCGLLSLRQSAEIIRRCRCAVGADTGLSHLACAVGTPHVVVLWGGHFGRFFPYSPLSTAVCLPLDCYGCNWKCPYPRWHCVKDIDPRIIELAVSETLDRRIDAPLVVCQTASLWNMPAIGPRWQSCTGYLNSGKVQILIPDSLF